MKCPNCQTKNEIADAEAWVEIAKCIGRAVAPYGYKAGAFYNNDKKYAGNVPFTSIETEAKWIAQKFIPRDQCARELGKQSAAKRDTSSEAMKELRAKRTKKHNKPKLNEYEI